MTFKEMTLRKVPAEVQAATGYVVRVFVPIEDVPAMGLPLTAELGSEPLEGLGVLLSIEPVLSGYLKTLPEGGEELVIKIGDATMPTGLTVDNPPIFA
jgi:hypothetical protein